MKRQGLITIQAPNEDRRRRHLTLTPKGRKAFATLDESSRRAMGDMLGLLKGALVKVYGRHAWAEEL